MKSSITPLTLTLRTTRSDVSALCLIQCSHFDTGHVPPTFARHFRVSARVVRQDAEEEQEHRKQGKQLRKQLRNKIFYNGIRMVQHRPQEADDGILPG